MKKIALLVIVAFWFVFAGCSSHAGSAGLGAVGGAVAGAGGYEFHLKKQMDRVEEDFKSGKIDQKEYDIRKDQIKRDSLLQ